MRRDDLKPSEKLQAMSDAFELLRKILPELPGVSEMLEFYNEAMKAIAGKIADIEDAQIKAYADLATIDESYIDYAPADLRDEIRKLVKLRKLMKILTKDCGNPPVPPSGTVVYSTG
jgi:GTP1/Obg family GTP-binding protein